MRTRICDAVCRTFWIHLHLPELTIDRLYARHAQYSFPIREHQTRIWHTINILLGFDPGSGHSIPPSAIMSALSRTPGPLIKDNVSLPNVSGAVRIRPPWPTADRDAIVAPEDAIKSAADFRIINERRGTLINRDINGGGLSAWETRQLGWITAACDAWIDKTCPVRYGASLEEVLASTQPNLSGDRSPPRLTDEEEAEGDRLYAKLLANIAAGNTWGLSPEKDV